MSRPDGAGPPEGAPAVGYSRRGRLEETLDRLAEQETARRAGRAREDVYEEAVRAVLDLCDAEELEPGDVGLVPTDVLRVAIRDALGVEAPAGSAERAEASISRPRRPRPPREPADRLPGQDRAPRDPAAEVAP